MDAQEITSVDKLVETLGGTVATVRTLDAKSASVVSNWRKRGNIPPRLAMKHRAILEQRGICASPSIWFGEDVE